MGNYENIEDWIFSENEKSLEIYKKIINNLTKYEKMFDEACQNFDNTQEFYSLRIRQANQALNILQKTLSVSTPRHIIIAGEYSENEDLYRELSIFRQNLYNRLPNIIKVLEGLKEKASLYPNKSKKTDAERYEFKHYKDYFLKNYEVERYSEMLIREGKKTQLLANVIILKQEGVISIENHKEFLFNLKRNHYEENPSDFEKHYKAFNKNSQIYACNPTHANLKIARILYEKLKNASIKK